MTLSKEEENALWFSKRQEILQEKLDGIMKQKTENQSYLVCIFLMSWIIFILVEELRLGLKCFLSYERQK